MWVSSRARASWSACRRAGQPVGNTIRVAISRDTSSSQHAGHAVRRNRARSAASTFSGHRRCSRRICHQKSVVGRVSPTHVGVVQYSKALQASFNPSTLSISSSATRLGLHSNAASKKTGFSDANGFSLQHRRRNLLILLIIPACASTNPQT